MKQIIVIDIKWDAPEDANLPSKVIIDVTDDNKHLLDDIEYEADALSDYLSDTYEYCHFGFDAEVRNSEPAYIECKENANKKSKYTSVGKIPPEETDKIYIAGWLTDDKDEDGEIIASINIRTNEVDYFDEDAKTDEYAQEIISDTLESLNLTKVKIPTFVRVKIPTGYLMIEAKGTETDFPGVYVSFSEDGKAPDLNNLIACVEYDTVDNKIKTETYCEYKDEPVAITHYDSGEIV